MAKKIAGAGHNSNPTSKEIITYLERIEKLEEERSEVNQAIRDIKMEAKGRGFDVKALVVALKARRKDKEEFIQQRHIEDTYLNVISYLD